MFVSLRISTSLNIYTISLYIPGCPVIAKAVRYGLECLEYTVLMALASIRRF